jgi:hypothetical protein
MAIDKLSDVLKQEAEGIMFPFRNKVKPVSDTTQEAYNSTTDGIMSITGKKYIGPDSVIQYGDSYQRQLKQIEKGMLPQFDQQQFPDVGEGIVEDRGFPKAQPVDTTPVQPDEPKFDPCPPGFKLINGVCQPVEQPRGNGGGRKTPTIDLKNFTTGLSKAEGSITAGGLNSMAMMRLEEKYGAEVASQIGLMNQKYGNKGALVEEVKDANGNPVIIDGKVQVKNIIPTPPETFAEGLTHAGIVIQDLIKATIPGQILSAIGVDETKMPKKLSPELQAKYEEYYEKSKSQGPFKQPTTVDPQSSAADATDAESTGDGLMSGTTSEPGDTFGEITTIDLKDSKTGEVVNTVNKRFTDNITTGHFRLSNTLATITNLQNRVNSNPRDTQAPRLLETAKDVAEEEFNNSIKEDNDGGNNSLSKSQKDYLDSDNRRALPGETKSANGKDLDSRRDFVPGRENEGYGFRSTSGNYNKSTNTFDQRFK